MRRAINVGFALAVAIGGGASAEPIVYSIHGDADGELDGRAFSGAQFRLELRSDTVHTVTAIENGVTVYRNDQGHAILFLTRGAQTTVAHIAPNQIFVRYDPDRKSTRLNSSHGYISYAVFCLKKKKYRIWLNLDRAQNTRGYRSVE